MKTSNRTAKLNFLDWLFLIFIGTFLLLFNYKSKAQPVVDWKINYNNVFSQYDKGLAIVTDNDCNSYIAGTTWNGMNLDYLIVKLNYKGDTVWTQTVNGTGNGDDTPTAMTSDQAGNLFVTGESLGIGSGFDYLTLKINALTGQIMNSHRTGNNFDDHPKAISMVSNGDVIVTGYGFFYQSSNSNEDFYTRRYDNSLNPLCNSYAGAGFDRQDIVTTLVVGPNGSYYLPLGNSNENTEHYWMVNEISPYISGCLSSDNMNGGVGYNYSIATSLLTSSGKLFVAGTWADDLAIKRYDNPGNMFISSPQYEYNIINGGNTVDGFISMTLAPSGNFVYLCGYTDADQGTGINNNIIVSRFNASASNGTGPDWVSIPFNGQGNGNDMPVAIFLDNSPVPSVYVVANTIRAGGLKEMIVLKYNSATGALLDTIEVTNTTSFDEICTGAARDNYGNIILTGYNDDPSGHQLIAAKICTNNFSPTITWTSLNTLMVSSGDSYQWFLNGNLLAGEDNQTINIGPIGNGNYTCEVTKFCCTFSTSMTVATVGLDNLSQTSQQLQVYPNPATDFIDIGWSSTEPVKSLKIVDISGRVVLENEYVAMNGKLKVLLDELTPGVYFIKLNSINISMTNKIIKQ